MFGFNAKDFLFTINNRVQDPGDYSLVQSIPKDTRLKVKGLDLFYKHKRVGSLYAPLVEYLNKMVKDLDIVPCVLQTNPFEVVLDVYGKFPEVPEVHIEERKHEYTYRTTFAKDYPLLVPDHDYECELTPEEDGIYVSICKPPVAVISSKDGKREKTLARMLAGNECITTARLTLIATHAELLTTVRF